MSKQIERGCGVVIVGAQWGDEGKGKIVDLLTAEAEVVVRYAGGPNAGHTLVVPNKVTGQLEKVVVRLVPSGIVREGTLCILGQGMVVDPLALTTELEELAHKRVFDDQAPEARQRLLLADRAHLIMPYHRVIDASREQGTYAVGTTKRGIGPTYEDKARRNGVHAGALRDLKKLERHVARALETWAPMLRDRGCEVPTAKQTVEELAPYAPRLVRLLADGSGEVEKALRSGKKVIFEGAQGTLLDLDHGTYPYVTSSTAIAGGACSGAGVGPTAIGRVVGIAKAYTTRVGSGPFPTELVDELGDQIRKAGSEFGSVTGRPRRCGWLDLPALRYARRVNGFTDLILTKLDVLQGLPELKICVAYDTPTGRTSEFPLSELDTAVPVYENFPGFSEPVTSLTSLDSLPTNARAYVERVVADLEIPLAGISFGPERDSTLALRSLFA